MFLAGIFIGKYHFKSEGTEIKKASETAVSSLVFDSLANQPIVETKVTPELLWKFGRIGEM